MDYRYLRAFHSVATHGSMTAAANSLGVAQSAISRQIQLLEESMGADLFIRGRDGIQLTIAGNELYQRLTEFDSWLKNKKPLSALPLKVGGLEGAINSFLIPRLAAAKQQEVPDRLILSILSNDEVEESLTSGKIDIGLSSLNLQSEWISSRKLYSEKIQIISRERVNLEDLGRQCWIGIKSANYLAQLAKNKQPQRFIQAGSLSALIKLVKAGKGIAAVSDFIAKESGLVVTPTKMLGEAIYMNQVGYKRQPLIISKFVKRFF